MRGAYLLFALLFLAGCGASDKDDKNDSSTKPEAKADMAEDHDTKNVDDTLPPPGQDQEFPGGAASGVPAPPFQSGLLQELTGTYEQVENRQAKLRIDQNYLVITNIELPVPTQGGTVRLTPRFPQHLRQLAGQDFFSTLGYYNDGDELWDNVELRIVPQVGTSFIDVSFVLSAPDTSPPLDPNLDPNNNQGNYNPCQSTPFCPDPCFNPCPQPCYPYNPCDPCYPYDPCQQFDPCFPNPCPPLNPCNPCPPLNPCDPCPDDDDDDEAGRILLYRFEKVEAAAPPPKP